jgi:hypothetical protein
MNLKSKHGEFDELEFAYLIEPAAPGVCNDQELYVAVHRNGRAVVRSCIDGGLELGSKVVLTPAQFESQWRGD